MSLYDNGEFVEVSFGGIVTQDELIAFRDDLVRAVEPLGGFNLLLDHSRARLDPLARAELGFLKDTLHKSGALHIASVCASELDQEAHTTLRLQQVLEGRESCVLEPEDALFPIHHVAVLKVA